MLDSFGDGFIAFDAEWRVIHCNRAGAAHYDLVREDILGQPAWSAPGLGEDSALREFVERARAAGAAIEAVVPSELRSGRWFFLRAFPLGDGMGLSSRDVTERHEQQRREREQSDRLELALATAGFGDWRWDPVTDMVDLSPRAAEMVGVPPGQVMTWTEQLDYLHPDDRARAAAAVVEALATRSLYEIEYRFTRPSDHQVRWMMVRGRGHYDDAGHPVGMHGVLTDITEQKAEAEAIRADRARLAESEAGFRAMADHQGLLINELNHRVKNTLATIQSLARQTLREGVSVRDARERLTERLLALSAAHNVLTRENWEGADLAEIAHEAMRPYQEPVGRVILDGPHARLAPNVALALSMTFHELATNAVKYGALSAAEGRIALTWTVSGRDISLAWCESGGPPVTAPVAGGFGTRLLAGLAGELGAPAKIEYLAGGLVCRLRAPAAACS